MHITILQWNAWYKEDISNVAKFATAQNADILCLQELTIKPGQNDNAPDHLAVQLGYNHYYKELDLGNGKINMANGIFSRYPIIDARYVWVNKPTSTGGYDDEYRALVEVTLAINNHELRVATVHMSYTDRFVVTPRKTAETDTLVRAIAEHRERFVLTGDFNAPPDSYTIKQLERYLKNAGPDYHEPTWTTKPFAYNGFEETQLRWRLDYVFTTPDIKVISSGVVVTDYSDHLPIKTVVDI